MAATSHLSMLEDAVYHRLMCLYYRTESPIPADLKQAARLVRAQTKAERAAVQQVLGEFFELQDDGWHNSRCDAEIEAYRATEPEREAKKANESNRLRLHREERARLFKALTDAGHHAPWNCGMGELRALVANLTKTTMAPDAATQNATPATAPETFVPPAPATAPETPATATQYPPPITQEVIQKTRPSVVAAEPPSAGNEAQAKKTMSPDEIIFGYGVPLLTAAGTADKAARSFLGKLRKLHGDETVVNTLRQCIKAKPLQPLEWLAKAMPPPKAATPEADEQARRAETTRQAMALLGISTNTSAKAPTETVEVIRDR